MSAIPKKKQNEQAKFWDEPADPPIGTGSGEPMARMFEFIGQNVHVVDVAGEPWFVLADVAKVLGYRDSNDAGRLLEARYKSTHFVRRPGVNPNMATINEDGLNRLILKSRSPIAKRFQEWVEGTVLISIRKTGGFVVDRIGGWRKKLNCGHEAAETRDGLRRDNIDYASLVKRCGGKHGGDYAMAHNAVYEVQFGKKAKQLKKELKVKDSPANHMGVLPMLTQQQIKQVVLRRAGDVLDAGGKLDVDQLLNGIKKTARDANKNMLELLGPGYAWDVIDDEDRGKILDACKKPIPSR